MRRPSEMDGATVGNPRRRRVLKIAGGVFAAVLTIVLGSTAFLTWSFEGGLHATPRFSPDAFLHALTSNVGWLGAFALLSFAILPLRALQWQTTLPGPVPFKERWHFVNIGAAAHNLLPGNLGDVTRAFLLARTQRIPFLSSAGSVVVCKLLELASLVLLAALAMLFPFWDRMPELMTAMRWGTVICLVAVAAMVALARASGPLAARLQRKQRLPRVAKGLKHLDAGLGAARSGRGMLFAFLGSLPPNASAALAYGIGLQAIGVPHGILAGPLVLLVIAFGKGLPGVPTGPGVYILVTSWAARALGATPEAAAAYALVTNVATGLSQWIPGLVSLAIRRVRWSELKQQTHLAADEAKGARQSMARPLAGARSRPLPTDS